MKKMRLRFIAAVVECYDFTLELNPFIEFLYIVLLTSK